AGGYEVTVAKEGKPEKIATEIVLVAVGRKPCTEKIGLENTKVKLDRGYVKTDKNMLTDEPGIYAIGDIVPTPQLAHVASAEGILAVEHIAGKNPKPINYDRIPGVTYCDPFRRESHGVPVILYASQADECSPSLAAQR